KMALQPSTCFWFIVPLKGCWRAAAKNLSRSIICRGIRLFWEARPRAAAPLRSPPPRPACAGAGVGRPEASGPPLWTPLSRLLPRGLACAAWPVLQIVTSGAHLVCNLVQGRRQGIIRSDLVAQKLRVLPGEIASFATLVPPKIHQERKKRPRRSQAEEGFPDAVKAVHGRNCSISVVCENAYHSGGGGGFS